MRWFRRTNSTPRRAPGSRPVPAWTGGTLSYIDTVGIAKFVAESDRLAQKFGPRFAPSAWLRDRAASGQAFY